MTTRTPVYLFAVLALTFAPCALAQESHPEIRTDSHSADAGQYAREDAHFFHLDFAVEERDGTRIVNRRDYQMTVATDDSGSLRSGDRVPIVVSDEKGSRRSGDRAPVVTSDGKGDQQYQYVDMGVKIDVSGAELQDGALAVKITFQVNGMPDMKTRSPESMSIIRDQEWKSRVLLPLNKPTTVYTSDDTNSTHTLALVVTPTLLR
jgi:hypothetical protein